jgi:abortive infection bacteriophage resistance protein
MSYRRGHDWPLCTKVYGSVLIFRVLFLAPYQKPYLSTEQQIAVLRSRGMEITDEDKAMACLSRIGYYRLSAYWYSNRKSEVYTDPNDGRQKTRVLDDFRDGTLFSDALDFYVFDKKLRLITLDALERVEVGIRTDIAISLGKHGSWAHRDPAKLHGNFARRPANRYTADTKHHEWLSRLDDKFQKSKEDFAKHFKHKYPQDFPPIWVAVELWDFGTLSHFFSGMTVVDKDAIASQYGLPSGSILETWLRTLNDIRNLCAHHSRLWNRNMAARPSWTAMGVVPNLDHLVGVDHGLTRFYASVVMLRHLLCVINPSTEWGSRLIEHVGTLPQSLHVTLDSAGFPENWAEQNIWK